MRMYGVALFLAVALPAMAAVPGIASDPSAAQGGPGWAKVEQLRLGQTIRVLCSGQRTWTGRLSGVSAGELELDFGGTRRKALRSEVLRIEVRSRATSALIGLGIGVAAGMGVGYAAGASLKSSEKTTAVGLGAVLFAPAGAALGALSPSWKTVYRGAPSGSPPQTPLPPR